MFQRNKVVKKVTTNVKVIGPICPSILLFFYLISGADVVNSLTTPGKNEYAWHVDIFR